MFMQEFDENHDGSISWEEFERSLERILSDLEVKAKKACNSKSYEAMMLHRRKQIRKEINPHDVYIRPLGMGKGTDSLITIE